MKTLAQRFSLVGGLVYIAIGIVGWAVTGFSGFTENESHALLGFDLNPFHNIVHLGAGAGLVAAARSRSTEVASGVALGTGVILLVAAVAGFTNNMQLLSIDSPVAADNGLHLVTGIAAVAFGLMGDRVSLRGAAPAPSPSPSPSPAATAGRPAEAS